MPKGVGGYQPDTKAASSRRADFDLRRQNTALAAKTDGLQDDVTLLQDDIGALQEDVLTVHDDIDAIRVDIGEIEEAIAGTPWLTLTLEGGWTNVGSGFATAAYRKMGDVVELRGLIRCGSLTGGSFSIFAAMASGYRPPMSEMFSQQAGTTPSTQSSRVDVSSDGVFSFWPTGTGAITVDYLTISGISYSVT